jgi:hypothetical protein
MAFYDVASIICQGLPAPNLARTGVTAVVTAVAALLQGH